MEDITGEDYTHVKRVCKDFEIKNLGEHHDLDVQIDTVFLAYILKYIILILQNFFQLMD